MTDFLHMYQEIGVIVVFLLMFVIDLFLPEKHRYLLHPIASILLTLQLVVTSFFAFSPYVGGDGEAISLPFREGTGVGLLFGGMYLSTPMASAVKVILCFGMILVFLQSTDWLNREDTKHKIGEFYVLALSALIGMYFMVSAQHFLLFFLGMELATIPMACLVAFDKYKQESAEAGAKYILFALFSSGIFLYGVSLLYGATGSLYFADIAPLLHDCELQTLAMVFIFAGLAFKLSLVPFHFWTADTYQGAPAAVGGMLSALSKGASAFALLTILFKVFGNMVHLSDAMLSIVIVVTITIGNLFAMRQQNLKRFMAFSSISQAGYLLLPMLGNAVQGSASLVYYIVVYIVANLAIFGVINILENNSLPFREGQGGGCQSSLTSNHLKGLYTTNPRLSMVMMLALFSLAGIPPFAGFFSKFFAFAAAFAEGHYLVVFIALINTVLSLYYYLLVVKAMFIDQPKDSLPIPTIRTNGYMRLSLVLCTAGVLLFGVVSCIYQALHLLAVNL